MRATTATKARYGMSSDESLSRVRRYRPRLRLVAELERVRLAASFFLALVFTAGFGCCCVLPMPGAPHDMALIVQASVVVVLWCWLIGRLTLFSPTQRLRALAGPERCTTAPSKRRCLNSRSNASPGCCGRNACTSRP